MQVEQRSMTWRAIIVAALLAALGFVILGAGDRAARSEAATATRCQAIVKHMGYHFYRASVLIVHPGQVTCAEARKVLWKATVPGGWGEGTIRSPNGPAWSCTGNGNTSLTETIKCVREDPEREVIKRGLERVCPHCTANKD